jgi:hypothetical protein
MPQPRSTSLTRQWPPLREAIEADRARLRLRSELERLAADWQQGHRDQSFLLRAARVAVFDDWAHGHEDELGPVEREYLEASRALELETAHREQGRFSVYIVLLTAVYLVLLALGESPFSVDTEDGVIVVWVVYAVNFLFIMIALFKGRSVLAVLGVFVPLVAFVAALRLARPRSPWARSFYRPGSARRARAEQRFRPARRNPFDPMKPLDRLVNLYVGPSTNGDEPRLLRVMPSNQTVESGNPRPFD